MSSTVAKLQIGLIAYVLAFLAVEGILRLIGVDPKPAPLFEIALSPVLQKEPWYSQWQKEHGGLKRTFQAYEIFKLQPYAGELITLDTEGYRKTTPEFSGVEKSISLFGGSIVWGSFVRNENTIPSRLSFHLNNSSEEKKVPVSNLGEIGYVFSQSLHRAIRLQYEKTLLPGHLVFFIGPNDFAAAVHNWSQGEDSPANLPWENEKYSYLFNLGKTGEVSWGDIFKKSAMVRASLRLFENLGLLEPDRKYDLRNPTPESLNLLSDQMSEKMVDLIRVAHQSLSTKEHTPIFIFAPMLFGKNTLSAEETKLVELNKNWIEFFKNSHEKTMRLVATLPSQIKVIDWFGMFWDDPQDSFVDVFHYTESGSDKIGAQLAAVFKPLYQKEIATAKNKKAR